MDRTRRKRLIKAGAIAVAALALATVTPPGPPPPLEGARVSALTVRPVPLDRSDPDRQSVGALRYLQGWELSAEDDRFGGISAIHVSEDQVIALSDAGTLLRFSVPGRGSARVHAAPLPLGAEGARKSGRDTESLALHGSHAWVGLEGRNEIRRYRLPGWQADAAHRPARMRRWGANSGAEGLVRLGDGRFLVFAEGLSEEGLSPVLLFDGDPADAGTRAMRLRYRPPEGFRVTDATQLPGGDLLVLNRRARLFAGISASLVRVRLPTAPEDGTRLEGREIARLARPLTVDNMEALSVTRENGRTILWIASDDNFSPLQRPLLLKFELRR